MGKRRKEVEFSQRQHLPILTHIQHLPTHLSLSTHSTRTHAPVGDGAGRRPMSCLSSCPPHPHATAQASTYSNSPHPPVCTYTYTPVGDGDGVGRCGAFCSFNSEVENLQGFLDIGRALGTDLNGNGLLFS